MIGIKTFWIIQNSSSVTSSINELNKRNAAKSMSAFDFSTFYIIPHDKLLHISNEITDFAFKGGKRDYVTVCSSGAFWSRSKSKSGRS